MSAGRPELALVMPVYNEEGAISKVVGDWLRRLTELGIDFEIHAYDDGSKDRSAEILEGIAARDARVRVHRKANSGHGPTILMGYRENCDKPWIFQIDSDDEMKPDHFGSLWAARADHDILVGERERIGQPLPRKIVSMVSRATVHALFGSAIHDVNAPYRLMRSAFFEPVFRAIPDDSFAPNLLVSGAASMLGARTFTVRVPQSQRDTGEVSLRKWKLFKAAARAFRQTVAGMARIRELRRTASSVRGPAADALRNRRLVSWVRTLGGLLVASLIVNLVTARDRDSLLDGHEIESLAPERAASDAGELVPETARQLEALGYAEYAEVAPDETRVGVDVYDPSLSEAGLNVSFAEWGCGEIEFFRNDGTLVRKLDVSGLPNLECYEVKPLDDGFVFLARPNLFRLDLQGELRWKLSEGFYFHHDFDATSDMIVALDKMNFEDADGKGGLLYDDRLVVLRPDGRVRKILSLHSVFWDAFRARADALGVSPFEEKATEVVGMDHPGDFYHANSVQILERDTAIGKRGNVLVSLRTIDTIATIDLETERVVWSWGPGVLDHQHHPQLLPNGNVLVFDNGWHRGHSRVVELDPSSNEIVWQYAPESNAAFFTKRRGSAYRLENGNTLITESDRGRAFEVTPDGRTVWQFWMPLTESKQDVTKRKTLFRLKRLSGDRLARILDAWEIPKRG